MDKPLCILIVEDSQEETEFLLLALRSGGYEVTYERVDTAEAMTAALNRRSWDIAFGNDRLSPFNGLMALQLLKDRWPDIPCLFVSSAIGEETVEAIKAGANDYIVKGNMKRLLPAVARALDERERRGEGKRAQEALRQSEERFRQLAENISEVFFMTNADGTSMIYMSPAYENIWGRSRQSVYDDPFSWLERLYPEDRARVEKMLREDAEHFQTEYRVVRPDGTIRWLWARTFPIRDEKGEVYRLAGFAEDITARKLAVEEAQNSQAQIRFHLDSTAEAIYGLDLQGRCTFSNQACVRLLGYGAEGDLIGENMHALIHHTQPDGTPFTMEKCKIYGAIFGQEGAHVTDEFFWRLDGSSFPVEYWSYPVQKGGVLIGSVVTFLDITERKLAVEALRISEERFRRYFELGLVGMAVMAPDKSCTEVNDQLCEMLGYPREELLRKSWEELTHPDDLAADLAQFGEVLAGKMEGYRAEKRFIHKDGRTIYTTIAVKGVRGADRSIHYFLTLVQDIMERKQAEEVIQRMAFYDPVTDLPNRNNLIDRLRNAVRTDDGKGEPMALLLMDLDHFKEINDTVGYHRGDALLKELGIRLRSVLFVPEIVAHIGGDVFAILVPKLSRAEEVNKVVEKIQNVLKAPFTTEGLPVAMEASLGIALYPEHGKTPEELLQRADIAVHSAKESGGGPTIYTPALDHHSPQRLALMAELRHAIEDDQLLLHYQPKINLKSKKVFEVEALVRWRHPQRGMILPDQFIGPAERTGLIHPLTHWVLQTAMRQCGEWKRAGIEIIVSANLSPRNLLDPRLTETVVALLRASGVTAEWIQFEITEGAIMADPIRALETMVKLHEIGIRFSIDDFGIGYSSLSYLQKLPVDQIKVDKSFVIHMTQNKGDAKIVRSTIDLAHNLGLEVVAEGVETAEVLDELEKMNCDMAQGYYFSRPLPPQELTRWLRESPWGLKS